MKTTGLVMATLLFTGCGTQILTSPPPPTDCLEPPRRFPQCRLHLGLSPTLSLAKIRKDRENGSIFPFEIAIKIENMSDGPVRLVMPGDGSDCSLRTPLVGWSILPLDSNTDHPAHNECPQNFLPRCCGTIGSLTQSDLFVLQRGHSRSLSSAFEIKSSLEHLLLNTPIDPGPYRIVFYYSNYPELDFGGVGIHDPMAAQQLIESDYVESISNEVLVEITP